jgi:thiol-disulfide isomerase/thioredoxin
MLRNAKYIVADMSTTAGSRVPMSRFGGFGPIPVLLSAGLLLPAFHGSSVRSARKSTEKVPAFAVVLIDSSSVLSNESLLGKIYMVDFWATWCPPCVEELPVLTKMYEKYHDRGFEIVSMSFDRSAAVVQRFRAKRFPMPWYHTIVTRGFGDYLAIAFGVTNIPRAVLVDRQGNIVAEDDALRGDRLERTLGRFLP